IKDFCERVPKRNSNKRVIEMLIKSHAFDSLIKDEWVEEGSNKQIAITQQFANERELSFDYIDYNDKKTQHETRVECYNIDWTQTVKAKFKKVAMRGAVDVGTYLKFKDQKNDITRVWGFVTKVTKKTSQNGNSYYQIMLSDEFGNQINARIPTYSKRNDPYIYMFENGEYGTKVSSFENTVKQLGNVYQGNINKSSWKGMEFFDFTSIHLIGNIWE
ncbi:MAG: hypothetical protein WC934_11805, partial [Acidithiobacillus sp.]|uniref:hypothetical protein n=1 Tax=Acidithiobacillus sp. TaxID=1872118 RepID=UPI00355F1F73